MLHMSACNTQPFREREGAIKPRNIHIPPIDLEGTVRLPAAMRALVIFAHGSGSSRFSPRNVQVAEELNARGIATILFDLLTREEEEQRANVFDIPLLARRLIDAVQWAQHDRDLQSLPIGLFGASTGAGAALVAAAELGDEISSVVSRGGRPDLAGDALGKVRAPTLLIVGGADHGVIDLNKQALIRIKSEKALKIIPGATHLFPEPGALEAVTDCAAHWFVRTLGPKNRWDTGTHTQH